MPNFWTDDLCERKGVMSDEELFEAIKAIPGGEGWYKSSGYDSFCQLANKLMAWRVDNQAILEMLEQAYGVVRGEYGD